MNIYYIFLIFTLCCQNVSSMMTKFLRCVHRNKRDFEVKKLKYVINLDDAICITKEDNYRLAIPEYNNINVFNKLYENGNEINYWTSRGYQEGGEESGYFTKRQLHFWGVKYDALYIGKNDYDVIIDKRVKHIDDINSLLKK